MPTQVPAARKVSGIAARHPVASYFVLAYAISWTGAFAVAAPKLLRHQTLPKMTGLLMFPVMLLGPSVAGILLTRLADGTSGLRDLKSRVLRFGVPPQWYAALLIPPVVISVVLFVLKTLVSPVFAPNRFFLGISFGVAAGFLEEIGCMGYAFPKLHATRNAFQSSVILGLLWGVWHMPVIDFLGTATPHAAFWLHYFLAFTFTMTAMRVLIAWIYTNTESVWLAQLMHISSTGSLVAFSPPRVNAGQEALWYAVYGLALWVIVMVVVKTYGARLTRRI